MCGRNKSHVLNAVVAEVVAAGMTHKARCDVTNKLLLIDEDWYHKPGTMEVLCKAEYESLPDAEKKQFVHVVDAAALGTPRSGAALPVGRMPVIEAATKSRETDLKNKTLNDGGDVD